MLLNVDVLLTIRCFQRRQFQIATQGGSATSAHAAQLNLAGLGGLTTCKDVRGMSISDKVDGGVQT